MHHLRIPVASVLAGLVFAPMLLVQSSLAEGFTRLVPIPSPRISASSEEYPGGNHKAVHLLDGKPQSEYSSSSMGTRTFVEFDLGEATKVAGFRHLDRNDPATIAESELSFLDSAGAVVRKVTVKHANKPGGETMQAVLPAVEAQRLRWQVTKLGPQGFGTVGGAEVTFYRAGAEEAQPTQATVSAKAIQVAERTSKGLVQPLVVKLDYPYAQPVEASLQVGDQPVTTVQLSAGVQTVRYQIPVVETDQSIKVQLRQKGGAEIARQDVALKPLRKSTVYILPHSHTDIGYTELQTAIEEKQVNNLLRGMELVRKTANYPEGARFVWNVEVLWAADLFLQRLGRSDREAFLSAVKKGQVALNGMYLNELTGLCRPEELIRLFRMATQLGKTTGVPVRSAMISDVPGYTWATVTAMGQAGIRYFSVAPNYFDRIGDILQQWENKPFYWVSPSGKEKVLVWIPWRGYAMSHIINRLTPAFVEEYQQQLEKSGYPFDIAHMRWAGHGDNAVPDGVICDFVKDWSAKYAWPKFVISSTTEAFEAFEKRYGNQLSEVRGDWTPYWEDGAGSSSWETALNRTSSDRVAQAESLWGMLSPSSYPAAAFEDAWRSVLLYSEHTWGAWCSVSEPARQETLDQWAIKHSYAAEADRKSRDLLSRSVANTRGNEIPGAVDVYNTVSWTRTELVLVPKDFCEGLDRAADEEGRPVPTQRLQNGDLVLLAKDLPAFSGRRYQLSAGKPFVEGVATVSANVLSNSVLRVELDEVTGAIRELKAAGIEGNLAGNEVDQQLNRYLYFTGEDPSTAKSNGQVKIKVMERGPLVVALRVESDAPGCFRLTREVRLVAGADHVELINTVDKSRLVAKSYHANDGKESLNFSFPFQVPKGQARLELPFGVIRPDEDQIPSACKNWFTVGRWADVANDQYGVTWITLDAPLVQVGGLTANLLNSQSNPAVWRKRVGPTQRLDSWAMNNHWGTNYRAYQEGPVLFRYLLRPHRGYDPAASSRLAIAQTQPLLPIRGRGPKPVGHSMLKVSNDRVLVTGLKPSDDGKALILRLWCASAQDAPTRLEWSGRKPVRVYRSDTSEGQGTEVRGEFLMPAWGVQALRVPVSASTK